MADYTNQLVLEAGQVCADWCLLGSRDPLIRQLLLVFVEVKVLISLLALGDRLTSFVDFGIFLGLLVFVPLRFQ